VGDGPSLIFVQDGPAEYVLVSRGEREGRVVDEDVVWVVVGGRRGERVEGYF
jgi:hypothetical protein